MPNNFNGTVMKPGPNGPWGVPILSYWDGTDNRPLPPLPPGFGGNSYPRRPANPYQAQFERMQRQFRDLYKSNPGAAMALFESSGQNRSQLNRWVLQDLFGGDSQAYNQWINGAALHRANYKYNPVSGSVEDLQGNVAHQGYGSTASFKPGSLQERLYSNPGGTGQAGQGGLGTSPQGTNPYEGMTTLYRDSSGMLHDPGDNPIPAPSSPTSNPYNYYNPNDVGWKGNGARHRNPYAQNTPSRPIPGLNNGTPFNPNFNRPGGVPATPTNPVAGPPTNPVGPRKPPTAPKPQTPNPTTHPELFGRDPNDPYNPAR